VLQNTHQPFRDPGAGALFDRTDGCASTVWVAAGINVLGMLVAGRLPAR
jgi:hypothetical protein